MNALRKLAIIASFALSFAAAAQTTETTNPPPPQPTATQPSGPLEGRAFGEHVSGMAPEHAILHGALFGECVSEMAITGECPHHEDDEEQPGR